MDELSATVPTTLPGLLALLAYAAKALEADFETFSENIPTLLSSLAEAAKALQGVQS